ncbi:MAG: cysteine desulfurase NifS [Lachnospirales bacterium]
MSIYLDNAATTKISIEVVDVMKKALEEDFGNPSSVYKIGRNSKSFLEDTRDEVASLINADSKEIFFTSGGTEADNWAIKGIAEQYEKKGNHIITSKIEHHAVLHTCEYLESKGFEVTYLDVDRDGFVNVEDLKKAIRPTTILITIMFANNEIGTLQPIKEIGAIAKENNIIFHTDAVQAFGHVPIDVKEMNIDMLSISAHKIYGPKGVGALYIRKGVVAKNLIHGGAQEKRKRAGTENTSSLIGFKKAVELAKINMDYELNEVSKLRDLCMELVEKEIPHIMINGSRDKRLPGNVNFSVRFIEGESLLLMLDMKDIYCSSGSACSSGSLDPSHVLMALGLTHEEGHGSLRVSFGKYNTKEEVETFVKELKPIVERLRAMSPLYEDFIKNSK